MLSASGRIDFIRGSERRSDPEHYREESNRSSVDWRLPCALPLAEATAQRIGSILSLRRGDVDLDRLPHGWIRFKAENQKTGHEHWAALSR